MHDVELNLAAADDAAAIVEIMHAAFGARGHIDPPPAALAETEDSVRRALETGDGVVAWVGGRAAGVILLDPIGDGVATMCRVSVHPDFQGRGIASAMVDGAHALAAESGYRATQLLVRHEYPRLRAWWMRHGYRPWTGADHGEILRRILPVRLLVPSADAMTALGERLARVVRAGDVIIASGDLGAGKTTLTQGLGAGLDVTGPVISPTFVLSRVHPARNGGPDLVHVDAYRLGDAAELGDIDLDSDLERSVTLVEWGQGLAEQLSDHRLEIDIERAEDPDDETRVVWIQPVGDRWDDVDLEVVR